MSQDTNKRSAIEDEPDIPSVSQRQKVISNKAIQNQELSMTVLRRIAGEKVAQEYERKGEEAATEVTRPISIVTMDELNSTRDILECIHHHLDRIHG